MPPPTTTPVPVPQLAPQVIGGEARFEPVRGDVTRVLTSRLDLRTTPQRLAPPDTDAPVPTGVPGQHTMRA